MANCPYDMWQKLRQVREKIETFVVEVITEQRDDKLAVFTRGILFVCSKIFGLGVALRRVLYSHRVFRDTTLGVQVIAIGNLTVGGTGKTPVVEKFARVLRDQGRKVAILSRGYKSKPLPLSQRIMRVFVKDSAPPRVVSDGKSLLLDSEMAGDEPYMLATNLRGVVVLVDKDRVKSGRYAIEKFGCDTLLLDDGFQYWKLRGRRYDIVLVDCEQPFGNGHLLPRGILREPPSQLARAHTIFITKSNGRAEELRKIIRQINPQAPIIECIHRPVYFEDAYTGERFSLEIIHGKRIAAFSGIASPRSFEECLVKLGAQIVYAKRFADHHRFTPQEVLNVINRSLKRQAEFIVTTQKDAVRLPKLDRRDLPIYFLRVEIEIISGATDFQDCVRKICFL